MWSKLETPDSEIFSLVWESKALIALNSAIGSFMAQQAYQEVAKWAITHVRPLNIMYCPLYPALRERLGLSQVCTSAPAYKGLARELTTEWWSNKAIEAGSDRRPMACLGCG